VAAASSVGASLTAIRASLKQFSGIPFRQEIVSIKNNVTHVNDTTATTQDAAIAALKRFGGTTHMLHWICGGSDKGLPFEGLIPVLKTLNVRAYLIPGTAEQKLSRVLRAAKIPIIHKPTFKELIESAQASAKPGDTILLSPACASFGLFKNEFDRGEQFNKYI